MAAGEHFLKCVPLNKTTFQLQRLFQERINGGLPGEQWQTLPTENWFTIALTAGRGLSGCQLLPFLMSQLKNSAKQDTYARGVATFSFSFAPPS
jgi:hypothetical protein